MGTSTLIWKKDNRIISAGQVVIRKDKRFRLDGYNLTMDSVQVKDEGEYVCEVETYNDPIQQRNLLTVLIPAQVEPNPQVRVPQLASYYSFELYYKLYKQCIFQENPTCLIPISLYNPSLTLDRSVRSEGRVHHHPGVQG